MKTTYQSTEEVMEALERGEEVVINYVRIKLVYGHYIYKRDIIRKEDLINKLNELFSEV